MEFLFLLEKIRNPVLDFFFSLITHIGEETFFLVIALFFFWCVNKREGCFILIVGLIGTVMNQALKMIFRIPRPWESGVSYVESAKGEATGYSFPSGHTQNVAGTFGTIAASRKNKWVSIASFSLIALVAFSRMYLGVHTPWDVLASLAIATLIVVLLEPIFAKEESFDLAMPYLSGFCIAISLALLLFVFLMPSEGVDAENLLSARKNACTLFGAILGLPIIYYVDKYHTKFDPAAPWYVQLIKLILGIGGVLAIQKGLATPLELLFGNAFVARGVRYFLVVMFAGVLYPMLFKFIGKIRIPFLEGKKKTECDPKTENKKI